MADWIKLFDCFDCRTSLGTETKGNIWISCECEQVTARENEMENWMHLSHIHKMDHSWKEENKLENIHTISTLKT